MKDDDHWMRRALEEGKRGVGLTAPNPAVGAVVVRDGVELGSGWHRKAGMPHAEREALADVFAKHGDGGAEGATIYVTLEPCSTTGRTPPCTQGVIDAGIVRVVYGVVDPNPDHAGAADGILREQGIEVLGGVLAEECGKLLRPFAKWVTTGLPWVVAKTAMSLDGRITRPRAEGQWLTGVEARAEVHRVRGEVDAIIVGGKTVRKDDPKLTVRGDADREGKVQPWRVVLTQSGRESLPEGCALFTDEFRERTLVYEDLGLLEVLQKLGDLGCHSVLLECGGKLMRQFAEADLVDEYVLFYAPMITGGEDFGFGVGGHFGGSVRLDEVESRMFGGDVMVRGVVVRD